MAQRPYRVYRHVFRFHTPQYAPLVFVRVGQTPCQAKGSAFAALTEACVAQGIPRDGWFLQQQTDITHEIPQMAGGTPPHGRP